MNLGETRSGNKINEKAKIVFPFDLLGSKRVAFRLFVLLRLGTLDLGGTAEGLLTVLALLACNFT